jgi:uncharacterized protein YutE (UPF0331/DUF86 family)
MVLRRDVIDKRLKELDEILQELAKYTGISPESLKRDLSLRWIIERGLIAGASVILEISDHILSSQFGVYAETYEESLKMLFDRGVISEDLYRLIKGLGGFRNILVHSYVDIDSGQVFEGFHRSMKVFPWFAKEVLAWLGDSGP